MEWINAEISSAETFGMCAVHDVSAVGAWLAAAGRWSAAKRRRGSTTRRTAFVCAVSTFQRVVASGRPCCLAPPGPRHRRGLIDPSGRPSDPPSTTRDPLWSARDRRPPPTSPSTSRFSNETSTISSHLRWTELSRRSCPVYRVRQ